jgi:energy-converting hydrogenase Eha subunit E
MNETTKSFVRHFLTVLGTIFALVGLNNWIPVLEFLNQSLDTIWAAIVTLIGFATTLFGFFKDKSRLEPKTETPVKK